MHFWINFLLKYIKNMKCGLPIWVKIDHKNGTSWGIWQYTSDGSMDGVQSERIDFDTAEINYEPIIKSLAKNGYGKYSK